MDQRLDLKPAELKDKQVYTIIEITNIAMHTTLLRATSSAGKVIKKPIGTQSEKRIYGDISLDDYEQQKKTIGDWLKNDPEFVSFVREEEENGRKVLLQFPKDRIPLIAGKDTQSFIKSIKGQRILRRLYKDNQQG
jgi:hypothetical protein